MKHLLAYYLDRNHGLLVYFSSNSMEVVRLHTVAGPNTAGNQGNKNKILKQNNSCDKKH